MLRRWLRMGLVGVVAGLVAGCGGAAGPQPGAASTRAPGSAASMVLRVSVHAPESDLSSKVIKYWGDEVTKKTGGRIRFRYFWAGSLVPVDQAFDAAAEGTTDIADVATSFISGEVPAVSVLEVPYAFPVANPRFVDFADQLNPVLDGIYQQHGQKLLFTDTGQLPVALIGRDRFFTSEKSFQGALIRTAGKWQAETIKAWGGKPVVISLGNLYTALQRGTVDATFLDLELTLSFKIYEVAKDLTPLDSSINYDTVDMNLRQWNRLSPADQQVLLAAGHDAEAYGVQISQQEGKSILQDLQSKGMKVETLPPQMLAFLQSKAKGIWPEIQKVQGPDGDKVMAVVQRFQPGGAAAR